MSTFSVEKIMPVNYIDRSNKTESSGSKVAQNLSICCMLHKSPPGEYINTIGIVSAS